ncbi:MAG: glycosyltransferase family 9 protein [Deltaproteobacteria bacterium]|nr:glycosyltransferase family 9 protein [Deltaproteobacteria bacterium]
MQNPENILVLRLSSLGDIIMTLPAVYSLKNYFPSSKIAWVCEGSACELLSCMRFVDEVIKFPRDKIREALNNGSPMEAWVTFLNFIRDLRRTEFDLVFDFHGILKSAVISCLTRKKRMVGLGKPYAKEFSHLFYRERINGSDQHIHKVQRNMMLVKYIGVKGFSENIPFMVPKTDEEYVEQFFRKEGLSGRVFVVNPFSSIRGRYKRWPLEYYRELIKMIKKEMDPRVIILWGTNEEKIEAEKLKESLNGDVILSWSMNVPKLLAFLSKVDLYIGGDSGITHLASLVKTPVVAIFGPSDHKVNSPWGTTKKIVRRDIECSPCKKRDCKERRCLTEIYPEQVFEAIKELYNQRSLEK